MKRASYRLGVRWIAINDEPTWRNEKLIVDQISVLLLADLFDIPPERVAHDVVRLREKEG